MGVTMFGDGLPVAQPQGFGYQARSFGELMAIGWLQSNSREAKSSATMAEQVAEAMKTQTQDSAWSLTVRKVEDLDRWTKSKVDQRLLDALIPGLVPALPAPVTP